MTRLIAGCVVAVLTLAVSACTPAGPAATRVVIVTLDTTRADRIGCYGYGAAATPNLDRLAGEAALFEQAVSPVPTTLPSHSTMFTGLYPQDHGVRYNLIFSLSPDVRTLAERLRDDGFATAGWPASFVVASRFGMDQGFDTFADPPDRPRALAISGRPAAEGVDQALAWLDARPAEAKSFLWLHLYDPHAPYSPPFPYSDDFRDRPYDGEIAYADAELGRLLERLARDDPDWQRTLLIVAGDHGEGLHDHRERLHGNLVYESTQRVPLIVRAPAQRPRRIAEPVTLADLTPTVLDLVGIETSDPFRGISLRPALQGRSLPRRDLYFESLAGSLNYGWDELRGVRYGDWKLIDSRSPELFDLTRDPGELNDLAALESERLSDLRAALEEISEPLASATAADPAHDAVLDAETEAFLASLGYVGGGAAGSAASAPHPRELIDLEPELLSAQQAVASGDWPRLEDVCRYVLGRDPTNKWGLHNLAQALMEQERAREAQDLGAELIRLYPEGARSYAVMALAYKLQGKPNEAFAVLQQGLERLPDSELLMYYALVVAFEAGQDDVCSRQVVEALADFPKSFRMLLMRARCEAREGAHAAALATLQTAVERGLRSLEGIEQVEEFRAVVATPEYRVLSERLKPPPPPSPYSEYASP